MIDFYYAPTPNGWKVAIMLEECDLDFQTHLLSIQTGEQFGKKFLAINPNAKIPAIVDHNPPAIYSKDSVSVFESGAILLYLAEKVGRYLATDTINRKETQEWLFWQVANLGPIAGQLSHFVNYAPSDQRNYGYERYLGEYKRCLAVLEKRLNGRDYIIGDYSICDIIAFPWVFIAKALTTSLEDFPNVSSWRKSIKQRPAVIKAIDLYKEKQNLGDSNVRNNSILFNQSASHILDT